MSAKPVLTSVRAVWAAVSRTKKQALETVEVEAVSMGKTVSGRSVSLDPSFTVRDLKW